MMILAWLAFGAVSCLIGVGLGCDLMRRQVDEDARHRAATERAFDKLFVKYRVAQKLLMREQNPWQDLETEIASLPVERRH